MPKWKRNCNYTSHSLISQREWMQPTGFPPALAENAVCRMVPSSYNIHFRKRQSYLWRTWGVGSPLSEACCTGWKHDKASWGYLTQSMFACSNKGLCSKFQSSPIRLSLYAEFAFHQYQPLTEERRRLKSRQWQCINACGEGKQGPGLWTRQVRHLLFQGKV